MDKMDIWGITKARAERKRIEEALQEATTAFDNSQPPPQPEEVTIVFQDDDNSVCSWANSDPDDSAANANAENSTSNTTAKSDNKTLTTDNYYDQLSPINNKEDRSPSSTNDKTVQESTNPVQAPQQPAHNSPPATSRRKTKWAQEPTEGHILFNPQEHSARRHGRSPPTKRQKQGRKVQRNKSNQVKGESPCKYFYKGPLSPPPPNGPPSPTPPNKGTPPPQQQGPPISPNQGPPAYYPPPPRNFPVSPNYRGRHPLPPNVLQ